MEEIVTYRAQGWRTITYNVQIDDPLDETPRLIRAPRGHDGADPPTITSVHGEWLFNFPLGRSGRVSIFAGNIDKYVTIAEAGRLFRQQSPRSGSAQSLSSTV